MAQSSVPATYPTPSEEIRASESVKTEPTNIETDLDDSPPANPYPADVGKLVDELLEIVRAETVIDKKRLFSSYAAQRELALDDRLKSLLNSALTRLADQKKVMQAIKASGRTAKMVISLNPELPALQTRGDGASTERSLLEREPPLPTEKLHMATIENALEESPALEDHLFELIVAAAPIDQTSLLQKFLGDGVPSKNRVLERNFGLALKRLSDRGLISRLLITPDASLGQKSSILIELRKPRSTPTAVQPVSEKPPVIEPQKPVEREHSAVDAPPLIGEGAEEPSRHREPDVPPAQALQPEVDELPDGPGKMEAQAVGEKNDQPEQAVEHAVVQAEARIPLTRDQARPPTTSATKPPPNLEARKSVTRPLRPTRQSRVWGNPKMTAYDRWNSALIDFFTQGAPTGSTIYLEVNDRNLELIGRQYFADTAAESWPEAFLTAVRDRLVANQGVQLDRLNYGGTNLPPGVAFLGVLVLVATRMDRSAEQQISEKDYFTRLNAALGTAPANSQVRRPKGIATGAQGEEPLWLEWADYLREHGFLPTATGGKGAWKYVGYAVSQTLLRNHEKRRLHQLFSERNWPSDLDAETLVSYLRREGVLPNHIKALLQRSGEAAEDVQHALSEAFLEWTEQGPDAAHAGGQGSASHYLQAGLYRTEHWRTGDPQYALFARQPRTVRSSTVRALLPDGLVDLRPERPGFFEPVGEAAGADLSAGARYPIQGHPQLEELVLPSRDFWILRADPETPGVYASLGRPNVGEHFLLLVREALREDLDLYREAGLLQWQSEGAWEDTWWEYEGAMVIANNWDDVRGKARELPEALRPAGGVSVSVSGGLVVPRSGAWLAAAPPQVRVNSFFTEAFLSVTLAGEQLFEGAVEPNQPVDVPWRGPGVYQLEVEARGQGQSRIVNLLDWDDLPPPDPDALGKQRASWGNVSVQGAQLWRDGGPA